MSPGRIIAIVLSAIAIAASIPLIVSGLSTDTVTLTDGTVMEFDHPEDLWVGLGLLVAGIVGVVLAIVKGGER